MPVLEVNKAPIQRANWRAIPHTYVTHTSLHCVHGDGLTIHEKWQFAAICVNEMCTRSTSHTMSHTCAMQFTVDWLWVWPGRRFPRHCGCARMPEVAWHQGELRSIQRSHRNFCTTLPSGWERFRHFDTLHATLHAKIYANMHAGWYSATLQNFLTTSYVFQGLNLYRL